MSQYKKSAILNEIRRLYGVRPNLGEDLVQLAQRNDMMIGIFGFDDTDLADLLKGYSNQAVIHRMLSQAGWVKRQVMIGGQRGALWARKAEEGRSDG